MIDISVDDSRVQRKITELGDDEWMNAPMEASLALGHDYMAKYPAQRPTRYRRTGDLGRHWTETLRRVAGGLLGELGNAVRSRRNGQAYGPFVQEARRQARIHRGYWQTDEDFVRENEARIRSYFEDALQEAAD